MSSSGIVQLDTRMSALKDIPVFTGVDVDVVRDIVNKSSVVSVVEGQYFFREGVMADSMFILERGEAGVFRLWRNQQIKLRTLHEGECFGEIALIDQCNRSASVIASCPSEAIRVSAQQLNFLKDNNPHEYIKILLNIGRIVSQRLRDADDGLFDYQMRQI